MHFRIAAPAPLRHPRLSEEAEVEVFVVFSLPLPWEVPAQATLLALALALALASYAPARSLGSLVSGKAKYVANVGCV